MKKIALALAGIALASSSFAEGFKLSGFLKAGWSNTIDALDTDADGKGDTAEASTVKWLAGDYFGGNTRSRLNLGWSNADDTAGAFVRLQYTGAAESWNIAAVKYANVYFKGFDGKVIMAAGKVQDNYIGSDGYEGFSFLDGNSGFFAGVAPIDGLVIGGGAVVDYLAGEETTKYSVETVTDEEGNDVPYVTKSTKSSHRASKNAAYAGAKYANDQFSVAAAYEFAGAFYGNVNVTAVKDLLIALEASYASDDALDALSDGDDGFLYDAQLTFVEQVEYTGIENLTLGLASYQFLNDRDIDSTGKKDNLVVTINPAVRYDINELFAASLEGTVTISNWDEKELGDVNKTFATIVPAFYFKPAQGAEAHVFASISTDKDQAKHQVGTGLKFNF